MKIFYAIATLWLAAFVPLGLPSVEAAARVVQTDCREFINETPARVTCGFISVPLDHNASQNQPDDRTILLPILIARSAPKDLTTSSRAILIPGAGGPGASMGFGYHYRRGEFLEPYQGLLNAGFDLVILDQRGAGLSTPKLTCFESIRAFEELITHDSSVEQQIRRYRQSALQCRQRFKDLGVEHFDTLQSALDYLRVMKLLKYDWWGTIATSYATVIAQTMLTINSEAFNKVVLDSPVPLDFQRPLTTESTYSSVLKSIAHCQKLRRCNARYPDLIAAFKRILRRSDAHAIRLPLQVITSDYKNRKLTLVINRDTLLSIFANAIYSNDGIVALPSVISRMDRGLNQALLPFARDYWYQSIDDSYADGLNLTVHCKERQFLEQQYIDTHPNYWPALSNNSRRTLEAQRDVCNVWDVQQNQTNLNIKPIKTPTIVISGGLDPVISREDIDHTVDDFTNVSNITVPGTGHAVWFQSECVRSAITTFFSDNNADQLSDCATDLPAYK